MLLYSFTNNILHADKYWIQKNKIKYKTRDDFDMFLLCLLRTFSLFFHIKPKSVYSCSWEQPARLPLSVLLECRTPCAGQRDIIRTNSVRTGEKCEKRVRSSGSGVRCKPPLTLKVDQTVSVEVHVSEDLVDLSVGHLFTHQLLHGLS